MQPEVIQPNQSQPESKADDTKTVAPVVGQPQHTKAHNQGAKRLTVDEALANKHRKKLVLLYSAAALITAIAATLLIVQIGLKTNTYSEALRYSNYASLIGWIMAITTGFLTGYIIAHPSHIAGHNSNGPTDVIMITLIIFGFIAGIIPGIIALIVYLTIKRSDKLHAESAGNNPAPLPPKPAHWFLVLLGFLFGVLPGLIISILISYPLSQHACRLSGSKYC